MQRHERRTRRKGRPRWTRRSATVAALLRWKTVPATFAALAAAIALAGRGPSPDDFPPDDHLDVLLASTAPGGGALALDYDFAAPIPVFASAGLGGFALYSASDPGFAPLESDEPEHASYAIEPGVAVTFEVTALDEGVRVKFGSVTLDEVGDTVVLGITPEVHTHGEWQVVVPEGVHEGDYAISFRVTGDSPRYAPSAPVTVVLALSADEPRA